MNTPPPCIVCGTALEPTGPSLEGDINQPYAGTAFTTYGHYGSTVFDPMSDRYTLHINVCDPCLLTATTNGRVLAGTSRTTRTLTLTPWQPNPHPGAGTDTPEHCHCGRIRGNWPTDHCPECGCEEYEGKCDRS